MNIIQAYPLELVQTQYIENIPSNHKILKVDFQGNQMYVWIMIAPKTLDDRLFVRDIRIDIYKTGMQIIQDQKDLTYLDSLSKNGLEYHIFKVF